MEQKKITIDVAVFGSMSEMLPNDQHLLIKAKEALKGSHSPYSQFRVGAAVRLADGTIVIGSNQENASFPAGLCAESVAVFAAAAQYPNQEIESVAITVQTNRKDVGTPVAPCGNCRQSISEFENKQGKPINIIMQGETGPIYKCNSMADLLPLGFSASDWG